MLLQGYGPLILAGTWQTVKLAVLSLALSFALGLIGAAAKLSKNRFSNGAGTVYTTLIPSLLGLAKTALGALVYVVGYRGKARPLSDDDESATD